MYYLTGKSDILKSIIILGKTKGHTIKSFADLRSSYIDFIKDFSGVDIAPPTNQDDQFCYDYDRIKKLTDKFVYKGKLTDIPTDIFLDAKVENMQSALERVSEAKEYIKSLDEDLYSVFELVIHTIYYARSPNSGGGSVSDALGVIWCSNRKGWDVNNLSEFLVHEFAHNLLFIDEICYKHYLDYGAIAKQENYAMSAVLERMRPLDKVFHSLIVAHEILYFRLIAGTPNELLIHPETAKLLNNCINTIDSIKSLIYNKSLVTERFIHLLNLIDESISKLAIAEEKSNAIRSK